VHADPASSEFRYSLLESTRYYAFEKLADALRMRRRHAEHFAARLTQSDGGVGDDPTRQWMACYASDIDNLRGALEWAFGAGGDVTVGLGWWRAATCCGPNSA